MDAAAGDPDSCSERLTNGIQPFERRKEGGMEVDQPAGVSVDQNRCDDSHPTRHDDCFNISRPECRHQRVIQGFTGAVLSVINELAGNLKAFSPLPGSTAWVVHNQQLQRGLEASL